MPKPEKIKQTGDFRKNLEFLQSIQKKLEFHFFGRVLRLERTTSLAIAKGQ